MMVTRAITITNDKAHDNNKNNKNNNDNNTNNNNLNVDRKEERSIKTCTEGFEITRRTNITLVHVITRVKTLKKMLTHLTRRKKSQRVKTKKSIRWGLMMMMMIIYSAFLQ